MDEGDDDFKDVFEEDPELDLEDFYHAVFNSEECTCQHEDEEHGWNGCIWCDCEASWEE